MSLKIAIVAALFTTFIFAAPAVAEDSIGTVIYSAGISNEVVRTFDTSESHDLSALVVDTQKAVRADRILLNSKDGSKKYIAENKIVNSVLQKTVSAGDEISIFGYNQVDVSSNGSWVLYSEAEFSAIVMRAGDFYGELSLHLSYEKLDKTKTRLFAYNVASGRTSSIRNPYKPGQVISIHETNIAGKLGYLLESDGLVYTVDLNTAASVIEPVASKKFKGAIQTTPSGKSIYLCESYFKKGAKAPSYRVKVTNLSNNKTTTFAFPVSCLDISVGDDGKRFMLPNYYALSINQPYVRNRVDLHDAGFGTLGSSKVINQMWPKARWVSGGLGIVQSSYSEEMYLVKTQVRVLSFDDALKGVDPFSDISGNLVMPTVEFVRISACVPPVNPDGSGVDDAFLELEYKFVGGNFRAYIYTGNGAFIDPRHSRTLRIYSRVNSAALTANEYNISAPERGWVNFLPLKGSPFSYDQPELDESLELPAPGMLKIKSVCSAL